MPSAVVRQGSSLKEHEVDEPNVSPPHEAAMINPIHRILSASVVLVATLHIDLAQASTICPSVNVNRPGIPGGSIP